MLFVKVMGKNNLVVFVCKDYEHHPETHTEILNVSAATNWLSKEGISLTINPAGKFWEIKDNKKSHSFFSRRKVGQSDVFNVYNLGTITYSVGVYNGTKINHIRDLVRFAMGTEQARNSKYETVHDRDND